MYSPQPVWDFWVRFGHWLIALGVIFQQISGNELELIDAHATVGILLSGLVVFRLVWGFIGPKYARFSSFPLTSPKQEMHSVQRVVTKQTEQRPGHTTVWSFQRPARSLFQARVTPRIYSFFTVHWRGTRHSRNYLGW